MELKQKITEKALEWYQRGIREFCQQEEILEISFDLIGQKAGIAYTDKPSGFSQKGNNIRFNLKLAEENEQEFLSQIIPHEVAHIIANKFYGQNCGHGELWKSVMIKWGLNPDRCHNFAVESSGAKFMWKCRKCGHIYNLGKNLHNKLASGEKRFCHFCKSPDLFHDESEEINSILSLFS